MIEQELTEAVAVEGSSDLIAALMVLLFGQDIADPVGSKRGYAGMRDARCAQRCLTAWPNSQMGSPGNVTISNPLTRSA